MGVAKFPHPRAIGALAFTALVGCALSLIPIARADYADGVFAQNHLTLDVAVRNWRKAAWQNDDFFSQVRLGDIYNNSAEARFYDPVEAYVWYYLAGRNRSARSQDWDSESSGIMKERSDRANDRQDEILQTLSTEERNQAHDRIVYILACRGAEGFLELGRASAGTDNAYSNDTGDGRHHERHEHGGRGARSPTAPAPDADDSDDASVIADNDSDALIYFHIADAMGNPLGRAYLNQLETRLRSTPVGVRIVERQARAFHYWSPPYEFYPEGKSPGGVPLTDECVPSIERQGALVMAAAIPAGSVSHALYFLGFSGPQGIAKYQANIPDEVTGHLTASQLVHAIQNAAVNGDAESQNTLGVMYAKGMGVLLNYARAEYWFTRAVEQRYPAAYYYLGVLYKAGPPGVDQDENKANTYFTNSALAGFKPTMNQLGALLDKAANAPPRPGQN